MTYKVVFELGGVLIHWNPRHLYRKLLPDEKANTDFLDNFCNQEWNLRQDNSRTFEEAIHERTALFPQHEFLIRMYYERRVEMLGGMIKRTVQILTELKTAINSFYALSNWSAEILPMAQAKYHFLNEFAGEVISGWILMFKPEPEIYFHLLKAYSLSAE